MSIFWHTAVLSREPHKSSRLQQLGRGLLEAAWRRLLLAFFQGRMHAFRQLGRLVCSIVDVNESIGIYMLVEPWPSLASTRTCMGNKQLTCMLLIYSQPRLRLLSPGCGAGGMLLCGIQSLTGPDKMRVGQSHWKSPAKA